MGVAAWLTRSKEARLQSMSGQLLQSSEEKDLHL